ncbi:MAG TPA: hypothetical protein EYP14_05580, partial [Planctomycetaceae bacterium]|nr:hypothetical protein [Planctomycetaceae bacterium]
MTVASSIDSEQPSERSATEPTVSPLRDLLSAVRWRLRRVLWLRGLAWLLAAFFGAALLAGSLDWLVGWDGRLWRLSLTASVLLTISAVGGRLLIAPLTAPLSDVELSLVIERRFPTVRDRLSSSVQFLRSGYDPKIGSSALQRRVVEQTVGSLEPIAP